MVAPEHSIANTHILHPFNQMHNHTIPSERPVDTAVNIQQGCSTSKPSVGGPRSLSPSPMDSSSSSKMDYAERVAIQNNMDIEINKPTPIRPTEDANSSYSFNMPTPDTLNHSDTLQPGPPLLTVIHQTIIYPPRLSLTAQTALPTQASGMETLVRSLYLALTNS